MRANPQHSMTTHRGVLAHLLTIAAVLLAGLIGSQPAQSQFDDKEKSASVHSMLRAVEALVRQETNELLRAGNLLNLVRYYGVGAEAYVDARRIHAELLLYSDTIQDERTRQSFKLRLEEENRYSITWREMLWPSTEDLRRKKGRADLLAAVADESAETVGRLLAASDLPDDEKRVVLHITRQSWLKAGKLAEAHALIALLPPKEQGFWQTDQWIRPFMEDIAAAKIAGKTELALSWLGDLTRALPEDEQLSARFQAAIAPALAKIDLIDEAFAIARGVRSDEGRARAWSEVALTLMSQDSPLGPPLVADLLSGVVEGVSFESLAATVVSYEHNVSEQCTGPRKRIPSVDAGWRYIRSGFIDCGYVPEDKAAMVLALGLFKRTSSPVAAQALERFERLARQQHHPVVYLDVDNEVACRGYQHSLDNVPAYLDAGATTIVRNFLSDIMRRCQMSRYEASQVTTHLTILGVHDPVTDRLRLERTLLPNSEIIQPILGGILQGLASNGELAELESAFLAMENRALALSHLYWGVAAYAASSTNFAIEHVIARTMSMYERYGEALPQVGVDWVTLMLSHRLTAMAASSIPVVEAALIRAINQSHNRHQILALANLQLATLELGATPDPARVAATLQSARSRREFLALHVDALVTMGRTDEAKTLAALLQPEPDAVLGDHFDAHYYAWARVAEGIAARGDLAEAFRLGVIDKNVTTLELLARRWERRAKHCLTLVGSSCH